MSAPFREFLTIGVCSHESEDVEKGSYNEKIFGTLYTIRTIQSDVGGAIHIKILQFSNDGSAQRHHEGLHRRNPCYCTGRVTSQRMFYIVVHKDTNAVDPAKAAEENGPSTQYYQLSFQTTIGE